MTRYRFTLDEGRTVYPAEGFDPSWNGWASPIVTRETLSALIAGEDPDGEHLALSFAGATATLYIRLPDATSVAATVLKPDPAGLYHLAPLGWTFHVLDNNNTPSGHPGPATGFTATWTMDFDDAATPQGAARAARAAQTAHGSLATVFTITDNATGQQYLIDLLTDDEPDTYRVATATRLPTAYRRATHPAFDADTMTVTLSEAAALRIYTHPGRDGVPVVQIDPDGPVGRLRVRVDDQTVHDADPDAEDGTAPR